MVKTVMVNDKKRLQACLGVPVSLGAPYLEPGAWSMVRAIFGALGPHLAQLTSSSNSQESPCVRLSLSCVIFNVISGNSFFSGDNTSSSWYQILIANLFSRLSAELNTPAMRSTFRSAVPTLSSAKFRVLQIGFKKQRSPSVAIQHNLIMSSK